MFQKHKSLSLLSSNLICRSAQAVGANKGLKKHDAFTFIRLLIYSHITHEKPSLRTIQADYSSPLFKSLSLKYGLHAGKMGKSTIADLLANFPCEFFRCTFEQLLHKYRKVLFRKCKNNVVKIDSTFISLSKKLLKCDATATQRSFKQQIKATIVHRDIPEAINFYFKKNQSDEKPFKKMIEKHQYFPGDIVVFDRGMQSRKSFIELDAKGISFITRLADSPSFDIREKLPVKDEKAGTLTLIGDYKAKLRGKQKRFAQIFRVIEAQQPSGKKIYFATNCWHLSAAEVCETYKSRWGIEVFFKNLKSYLNGKHFLSRRKNGIINVYYIRLITAMLLTVLGAINKLVGFKQCKYFAQHVIQKAAFVYFKHSSSGVDPPNQNIHLNFTKGELLCI